MPELITKFLAVASSIGCLIIACYFARIHHFPNLSLESLPLILAYILFVGTIALFLFTIILLLPVLCMDFFGIASDIGSMLTVKAEKRLPLVFKEPKQIEKVEPIHINTSRIIMYTLYILSLFLDIHITGASIAQHNKTHPNIHALLLLPQLLWLFYVIVAGFCNCEMMKKPERRSQGNGNDSVNLHARVGEFFLGALALLCPLCFIFLLENLGIRAPIILSMYSMVSFTVNFLLLHGTKIDSKRRVIWGGVAALSLLTVVSPAVSFSCLVGTGCVGVRSFYMLIDKKTASMAKLMGFSAIDLDDEKAIVLSAYLESSLGSDFIITPVPPKPGDFIPCITDASLVIPKENVVSYGTCQLSGSIILSIDKDRSQHWGLLWINNSDEILVVTHNPGEEVSFALLENWLKTSRIFIFSNSDYQMSSNKFNILNSEPAYGARYVQNVLISDKTTPPNLSLLTENKLTLKECPYVEAFLAKNPTGWEARELFPTEEVALKKDDKTKSE